MSLNSPKECRPQNFSVALLVRDTISCSGADHGVPLYTPSGELVESISSSLRKALISELEIEWAQKNKHSSYTETYA